METIVVGVDGSACARAALGFAAREAALREARLRIVCAWEIPPAVYAGGFAPTLDQPTLDGFRDGAETVVQEAVASAKELQSAIECEGKTVQGQPAEVLLKEAQDADLIVLGNRGHGGFASLLLGSVGHQVVGAHRWCVGRQDAHARRGSPLCGARCRPHTRGTGTGMSRRARSGRLPLRRRSHRARGGH